jgi:hypothetical protein
MSDENKKDKDPIGKALGLPPEEKIEVANGFVDKLKNKIYDNSASQDFEMARANVHGVIETGKEALITLTELAGKSQHPRAFEVVAKLMDTLVSANKELLDLQEKIRKIDHSDAPVGENAKNVTQNLFVGSTAELQKIVKELKFGNQSEEK